MAHAAPPAPRRASRFVAALAALVVLVVIVVIVFASVRSNTRSAARPPTPAPTSLSAQPPATASPSTPVSVSTSPPPATPARSTAATRSAASSSSRPPSTSPSTPPSTDAGSGPADPKAVALVVVNNTGRSGVATRATARLERDGWKVTRKVLYSGGILSSCAYYDPHDPANKVAAQALKKEYPHIQRIKARFDALPAGRVVLVLKQNLV